MSSFLTNAGFDLSHEQRLELQEMDKAESYIEDMIAAASNYDYRGFFNPGEGRQLTVSKDQVSLDFKDMLRLRDKNFPIKPIFSILAPNGGQLDVYPDVVQEAFDAGYICEECTQWQEVPHAPECNWLHNAERTANKKGCGSKLLLP